ncbi:MAG: glycoside hydrolase family 88 protein [Verrucomicrobiae bacterium]|nr:glycoside hydrolase family 88 protein [Verrucomicrobiae bacterium]
MASEREVSRGAPRGALRSGTWKWACLATWAVILALVAFELWPRFRGAWGKTPWGSEHPWRGDTEAFLSSALEVASKDLMHPAPRLKLDPRRMERPRTLLWLRDRLGGGLETPNSWPNAVLARAIAECGTTADATLGNYWDQVVGPDGSLLEPPVLLSHCMLGMPLLDCYQQTSQARFRTAAEHLLEWLMKSHVRSATGTLPYRPEEPGVLLVDTLGMVCPFLARAGREFDMPEATRLARQQLLEFLDRGMDERSGLPFHAYQVDSPSGNAAPFGLAGWGRGAGWLALGLAETLHWLPATEPDRPRLEEALRRLAATLRGCQRADGLWGWAVNIPGAQPDTSATGMIAWALRIGMEDRVLDDGFQETREKAIAGILRCSKESGEVGQSMADVAGIGQYPWLFAHTTWTQGFAILAVGGGSGSAGDR